MAANGEGVTYLADHRTPLALRALLGSSDPEGRAGDYTVEQNVMTFTFDRGHLLGHEPARGDRIEWAGVTYELRQGGDISPDGLAVTVKGARLR